MNKNLIINLIFIFFTLALLTIIYKIWGDISNLQSEFINLKKINEDLILKINTLEAENTSLQNVINNKNKKIISLIEMKDNLLFTCTILIFPLTAMGVFLYFGVPL